MLVTGGAGLLGQALVRELIKPGADGAPPTDRVRILDVRDPPAAGLPGVEAIRGDVRSLDALRGACRGVDAVIHCASLVDYGHASERDLRAINVDGTANAIAACRERGVRALVYTSTMDVVHAGEAIRDGDESLPYPEHYNDAYAASKAEAERLVLAASGPELPTCALRPCGMYGEADPHHVSSVLRTVQAGRLSARLGDGHAVFQHVYVGNVAHGHVLAARRLLARDPAVAGSVYFLTDFPALNFFDFMETLMKRLGHEFPPQDRRIPYPIAFGLGAAFELAARLARPLFRWRPLLTRSSVRVVCKDLSFGSGKAARELGYAPIYSEAEALERTVAWFREHGPVDPPMLPGEA